LGPNQVCTLLGAKPGFNTISGRSYLLTAYDMDDRDIWRRNFVVLLGWILFYQVTQILILDFLPVSLTRCSSFQTYITKQRTDSALSRLFVRETSETHKLNDRLRERKASRLRARIAEEVNPENTVTKKDVT
jgi:ATP-binding cassette subfamily G (WHITE) protein 2 (SNQ2)